MRWTMPAEAELHERTWMAFPTEGQTLGSTDAEKAQGYRAWADVALAVSEYEPVTMLVDPSESSRARNMLGSSVELLEAPIDEYWMRDIGPTFVRDLDEPTRLCAVDWVFNGWGANQWAVWDHASDVARIVAEAAGVPRVASLLVNEGGGIHTDGQGTVLATRTVQLDSRRNPYADEERVEAEFARLLGAEHVVWLPRGLTRDYEEFGTNGHVDIVASLPSPGTMLLHAQESGDHPDHTVMAELREVLARATDAAGRPFEILEIPAPRQVRDVTGYVDWSYINHYMVNGAVIACSFGDEVADAQAKDLLGQAYPGRQIVSVEARPIFDRGGGIHCITQQQPASSTGDGND